MFHLVLFGVVLPSICSTPNIPNRMFCFQLRTTWFQTGLKTEMKTGLRFHIPKINKNVERVFSFLGFTRIGENSVLFSFSHNWFQTGLQKNQWKCGGFTSFDWISRCEDMATFTRVSTRRHHWLTFSIIMSTMGDDFSAFPQDHRPFSLLKCLDESGEPGARQERKHLLT